MHGSSVKSLSLEEFLLKMRSMQLEYQFNRPHEAQWSSSHATNGSSCAVCCATGIDIPRLTMSHSRPQRYTMLGRAIRVGLLIAGGFDATSEDGLLIMTLEERPTAQRHGIPLLHR
jgi:hypothetical protein